MKFEPLYKRLHDFDLYEVELNNGQTIHAIGRCVKYNLLPINIVKRYVKKSYN